MGDIDRAPNPFAFILWQEGFGDANLGDVIRCNTIKGHTPVTSGGEAGIYTIELDIHQRRIEPAHRNKVAIACLTVAPERDAGDPAKRFGDIIVGQTAGIISRKRIDDLLRVAFGFDGQLSVAPASGDGDHVLNEVALYTVCGRLWIIAGLNRLILRGCGG